MNNYAGNLLVNLNFESNEAALWVKHVTISLCIDSVVRFERLTKAYMGEPQNYVYTYSFF